VVGADTEFVIICAECTGGINREIVNMVLLVSLTDMFSFAS
jgi:hypothetical protein